LLIAFYVIVFLAWLLSAAQGLFALVQGFRFNRHVTAMLAAARRGRGGDGRFRYQPKAAVILPCCGVDERLHRTVASLMEQDYDGYEVVFTFESESDPAYGAVGEWTSGSRVATRRVIAGRTQDRSQKIHNLLAALEKVSPEAEVLVFLDSDAVPPADWLGHLVAPLADETVGAATGFRWYSADGGLACGLRSAWNASAVTMLDDERMNFCWGGSTAIRRATFEKLEIAQRWARALSDDYQMTRAVRGASLRIVFVPQALLPTRERTTLGQFLSFATRQIIITRVCAPWVWRGAMALCLNHVIASVLTLVCWVGAAAGVFGTRTTFAWAFAAWASLVALAGAKSLIRQIAIRRVLKSRDLGWKDLMWDVCGVGVTGAVHLVVLLRSMGTRRIEWRGTIYELVSADETRVIGRRDHGPESRMMIRPAALHMGGALERQETAA